MRPLSPRHLYPVTCRVHLDSASGVNDERSHVRVTRHSPRPSISISPMRRAWQNSVTSRNFTAGCPASRTSRSPSRSSRSWPAASRRTASRCTTAVQLAITIGWLIVGGLVTLVALAMGEVCSVYPTAGGLYWWAYAVATKNKAAVGMVRRLVQLPRSGRGHRRHRLRRGLDHNDILRARLRPEVHAAEHVHRLPGHHRAAWPAEHVRRQPGEGAFRHQRVVALRRRRVILARPLDRAGSPLPDGKVFVAPQQHRAPRRRRRDLRVPHRIADGAVHVHRLRRQRASIGRDARGGTQARRGASSCPSSCPSSPDSSCSSP